MIITHHQVTSFTIAKLTLRDTTLEFYRNGQDKSPVMQGSTVDKAIRVQDVVKRDQIVASGGCSKKYSNWTTGVEY